MAQCWRKIRNATVCCVAPLDVLSLPREEFGTLAAHLPDDLVGEVLRLQVTEFLVKPVRPDSLLVTVEALLSASQEQSLADEKLAADNAALHRRLEDWRSAVSIGRAVVQIHDLDTLLARIVEAAVYLCNAEEGSLYLVEPVPRLTWRTGFGRWR